MAGAVYGGNQLAFAAAPAGPAPTPIDAINQVLTRYTAEQLADFADRLWEQPRVRDLVQGTVANNVQHQGWSLNLHGAAAAAPRPAAAAYWYHIIYAYLLEC